VRSRLVYLGYAAGWALLRTLPERLARRLFAAGADLAYRRRGAGTRRLETNLRRVLGPDATEAQFADVTRAGLRSYARYWYEVFRIQDFPIQRIWRDTVVTNRELLDAARASGVGTVLVLPHIGNWDAAGYWCTSNGYRFTTVAERLEPARLFERFKALREALGMEVVALAAHGTGRDRTTEVPPFELLADRLQAGGMLCLLGDRDLTARGVDVELFGETARFPAGPAALAVRTGAWLIPVDVSFEGAGWGIHFLTRVPVPETGTDAEKVAAMTQEVARWFERGIAAHPQDWHMLQRLWLADLDEGDTRRAPLGPPTPGAPPGRPAER
jgi:KDO2-lipid IV(A) lauroyltransferase